MRISVLIISALAGLSAAVAHSETEATPGPEAAPEVWSLHFQATVVTQGHPAFTAPYSSLSSLDPSGELKTSVTSTLYVGRRLWSGGEAFYNAEVTGGEGLSTTHGMAGFPNGEIYRVDTPSPKYDTARLFIRQTFAFGDDFQELVADSNQLAGKQPKHRLVLLAGRFSLNDYFDDNTYSHDPRTQFLNWGFMDNLAWDYAADTRGYTWGFLVEYAQPAFAIRFAEAIVPTVANGSTFDTDLARAHSENLEVELRRSLSDHPGRVRLLAYANEAHMGSYAEAVSVAPTAPIIENTADYRTKFGFGLNLEQDLGSGFGAFARLGWNDGKAESFIFTECDRTASLGASLRGIAWSRPEDVAGLALLINGISSEHADYLAAGGHGFLLGDGALNYAPEEVLEGYYLWKVRPEVGLSGDVQYVRDPGYNADRGPVWVLAARAHYEF